MTPQNDQNKSQPTKAVPFKFHKTSIDQSNLAGTTAILIDEFGDLVAGGWFVNPSEYPSCTAILSLDEFKQKAVLVGDYYEVIVRGNFSDSYDDVSIT